ncbi:MAG: tryptophan--tRNA ligase [Clostridia bacterium]|nr:tryptophan--tRNA ligase [Clostridia bacterium]
MEQSEKQKRIFSAVQPSGNLTLGNYLGALKNWADLQDEFECIYCVADLHAITVRQDSAVLRKKSLDTLALYLASGIDPKKAAFFLQSHVPEHTQLSWVLGCNTMFGELSRMTQFKDKSQKHADNINAGLFTYPVLMAADILLYQADLVPVGSDQKQHIELARDIANRFNGAYSPTFTVPEAYILKSSARIMSLAEPERKMSKSDPNVNASIFMLDRKDDIIRKFKRAVTDSEARVAADPARPGIFNLVNIYSSLTGKTSEEIEREFEGKGYGDFKLAVGEACADALSPLQAEFDRLTRDKAYLDGILKEGTEKASYIARKTVQKVYRKVDFYQPRG